MHSPQTSCFWCGVHVVQLSHGPAGLFQRSWAGWLLDLSAPLGVLGVLRGCGGGWSWDREGPCTPSGLWGEAAEPDLAEV